MMDRNIRLGRIAGVPVGLNWSVLLIFWLIAWSLAGDRLPREFPGQSTATYWTAGVATALVFFASLLAHEMAHALMARREKVPVEGITLWLFGGIARLRGEAMSAGAEFRIAIVGPLASLAAGALFWMLGALVDAAGAAELVGGVLRWLARINVTLAIFNMVPAFPLDGGRVLRAWLWRRRDRARATKLAARVGSAFGFLMVALGLLEVATSSASGGLWLVFLGWFLTNAARSEESSIELKDALSGVVVGDVMSPDPVIVPAWISLESFVRDYALTQRSATFPVRGQDGGICGLISVERVTRMTVDERTERSVGDVALPLEEVATARSDEPFTELLERLPEGKDEPALVFEGDRLTGLVSPRDVARALESASKRGRGATLDRSAA